MEAISYEELSIATKNYGGNKMAKKRFQNWLQLFAEDPAGGNDPAGGADPSGADPKGDPNPKDPDPKADPKKDLKYSDEDIDRIIGQKFAKWQAEQDKKIKDAEARAKMSAEELAAAEKAELEKKVKDYEAKEILAQNRNLARQTLAKADITVPDELLVSIVSADEAETQKAADSFVKLFKAEVAKAVGDKLKGGTPKGGTGGGKTLTKKEIMAIKNPAERQKLIAENMELFQ